MFPLPPICRDQARRRLFSGRSQRRQCQLARRQVRRSMTNCRYPLQLGPQRAQFRAPLWALRVSSTSTGADVRPRSAVEASRCLPTERETVSHSPSLCNLRAPQTIAISVTTVSQIFHAIRFQNADNVLRCAVRTEMLDPIPGSLRLRWKHIHSSTRHPGPAALSAAQSRDLMRTNPASDPDSLDASRLPGHAGSLRPA